MLAQSCKFGVNCCFVGSPRGLHLSACASDFWICHSPPPLTQFAQKRCQSTGLELRILLIYLIYRRSGLEIFWRGDPKILIPQNFRFRTPIESSWWEDSKYIFFNRFDTKVTQNSASCSTPLLITNLSLRIQFGEGCPREKLTSLPAKQSHLTLRKPISASTPTFRDLRHALDSCFLLF